MTVARLVQIIALAAIVAAIITACTMPQPHESKRLPRAPLGFMSEIG